MHPHHHIVQLQIDGEWKTFYTLGCGLSFNCRVYRELRAVFRQNSINYPCRLVPASPDGDCVVVNQLKHEDISNAITVYVENNETLPD